MVGGESVAFLKENSNTTNIEKNVPKSTDVLKNTTVGESPICWKSPLKGMIQGQKLRTSYKKDGFLENT